MKRIDWNWKLVEDFEKVAVLTNLEKEILVMRVKEYPNSVIMDTLSMSKATLHRKINKILAKYKDARKINPNLPEPRKSAKEIWMDTH